MGAISEQRIAGLREKMRGERTTIADLERISLAL